MSCKPNPILFQFFHCICILSYLQKNITRILVKPVTYYKDMKGKNTRNILCEYFGSLYCVPKDMVDLMKWVCNECHNASLVIDDIQDNSTSRRNLPCAHLVYGTANTLNAGYLTAFRTLSILPRKLREILERIIPRHTRETNRENINQLVQQVTEMAIENIHNMHIGQGLDIYWSTNRITPSMDEYLQMIEYKTGILFTMVIDYFSLIMSSTIGEREKRTSLQSLRKLCHFFQIRDDYINIADKRFWEEKGICEDFDEKKQTYPIILFYHNQTIPKSEKDAFFRLFYKTQLSFSDKLSLLSILNTYGILNQTYQHLMLLKRDLEKEICIPFLFERLAFHSPFQGTERNPFIEVSEKRERERERIV